MAISVSYTNSQNGVAILRIGITYPVNISGARQSRAPLIFTGFVFGNWD
ncbi:hypothetical protein APA_3196 [Pseudanabaena sp. lw0831]|nr:hypothetical protein APA_3196 [Pseudanabaena sp. lw0831]